MGVVSHAFVENFCKFLRYCNRIFNFDAAERLAFGRSFVQFLVGFLESRGERKAIVESAEWTALGKTSSDSFYKSAGKDFKFDGKSGESVKFAMKGGGEK
jgi:hypothetical protein